MSENIDNGFVIRDGVLVRYSGTDTNVIIPQNVTKIGTSSLAGSVVKVIIPEGVSSIEGYAFYNNRHLTSISLPHSLTTIEKGAFSDCKSLTEIIIPEGVKTIGDYAFNECEGLKKVSLPKSLETIGRCAFANCKNLKSLSMSDNTHIEMGAFENCRSLNSELSNRVEEYVIVRDRLCKYNGKKEVVVIPGHIRIIENAAFSMNKKITEVIIPDTVTIIGQGAFKGCTNLRKISMPQGLKRIESEVFWDCKSLEEISISEGLTVIGESAFRHCYSLKEILLPYSVKEIQVKAFSGVRTATSTDIHSIIIAPGTIIDNIVSPEDKFACAMGYIRYPELFRDEAVIQSYCSYFSKKKKDLLKIILKNDIAPGLRALAEFGLITAKTAESILSEAHKNKAIECTAFLIEWKNNNVHKKLLL